MRRVGRLTLNRNPDNFFAETEQVAVPHRQRRAGHRLHQRPAAAGPAVLLHGHAADPAGRAELPRDPDQPAARAAAQQPARRLHAPGDQPGRRRAMARTRSAATAGPGAGGRRRVRDVSRSRSRAPRSAQRGASFFDHYSQARMFFRSQSEPEQQHLIKALRFELGKVHEPRCPRADGPAPRADRRAARRRRSRQGLGLTVPPKPAAAAEPERPRRRRSQGLTSIGPRRSRRRLASPEHGDPRAGTDRHPEGRRPRRRGFDAAGVAALVEGAGRGEVPRRCWSARTVGAVVGRRRQGLRPAVLDPHHLLGPVRRRRRRRRAERRGLDPRSRRRRVREGRLQALQGDRGERRTASACSRRPTSRSAVRATTDRPMQATAVGRPAHAAGRDALPDGDGRPSALDPRARPSPRGLKFDTSLT